MVLLKTNYMQFQYCFLLLSIVIFWSLLNLSSTVELTDKYEFVLDEIYPNSNVKRIKLVPHNIYWLVELPDYKPIDFTHPSVYGQPWADDNITAENYDKFKWNEQDGKINRQTCKEGTFYELDMETLRPLNPTGRTGICGRGLLGRWGPNHAAVAIATRWCRDFTGEKMIMEPSKKPILEVVAVKIHGIYLLPGGFSDPGESHDETARREFIEEALNGFNMTKECFSNVSKTLEKHFDRGEDEYVYKGYFEDNRNTDNAWIEGHVKHWHDETGVIFTKFNLTPGDGAKSVKWLLAHKDMTFDPIHKDLIRDIVEEYDAHW